MPWRRWEPGASSPCESPTSPRAGVRLCSWKCPTPAQAFPRSSWPRSSTHSSRPRRAEAVLALRSAEGLPTHTVPVSALGTMASGREARSRSSSQCRPPPLLPPERRENSTLGFTRRVTALAPPPRLGRSLGVYRFNRRRGLEDHPSHRGRGGREGGEPADPGGANLHRTPAKHLPERGGDQRHAGRRDLARLRIGGRCRRF